MRASASERAHGGWSLAGLDGGVLLLIAACSATFFLDCLIPALMGPLAGPIAASLALDPTEVGAVFSANLVGQCLGLLLIPLLANRLGHRRLVLWTTFGFGLTQALTAFVDSRDMLVASRFVTGVFLGGALPSCVAAVTQATPPARRGLGTMLLFTAFGLGGAVAGFLGSQFLEGERWRHAFVITGGACLLALLACWKWLHVPPEPQATPIAGAATEAAAGPRPPARLLAIVSPPLLPGTLLLWLMFVCALTIYYCLSSWLPTLLVDIGRSPALAAYAVGSFTSGGVVSGLLIGPLIDRYGARRILVLFFAIAAVLLFVIGQGMETLGDGLLLLMLATCGFFMLGGYGGMNVVLAAFYPAEVRAVGIGWAKSIGRLGTIVPPIAIGYALSLGISGTTIVTWFTVPALLLMASLWRVSRDPAGLPSRG